jgi:hypothetical protein
VPSAVNSPLREATKSVAKNHKIQYLKAITHHEPVFYHEVTEGLEGQGGIAAATVGGWHYQMFP